jgi:predicted amidohydrolase
MNAGRLSAAVVFAGWAIWIAWPFGERSEAGAPVELFLRGERSFGTPSDRGNVVAIQPFMVPADYASADRFSAKLGGYLAAAEDRGYLGPKTVVVLPEHLATWLVAIDESDRVYRASSAQAALIHAAIGAPLRFAWFYLGATSAQPEREALFRLKGPRMAEVYQRTFAALALRHRVDLVAGSIVLPAPRIEGGRLIAGDGPLFNVSATFDATGALRSPLVMKAFPVKDEQTFLSAAPVEALPVYPTPAGRLAVLICADSWFPESYRRLAALGAELVVVPAYLDRDGAFGDRWPGYNGWDAPTDVDPRDVGAIDEGAAWKRYALLGRIGGAQAGVTVFLRGQLWDLGADGHTLLIRDGERAEGPDEDAATLVNLWL